MKKQILNLGKVLSKFKQQEIKGGGVSVVCQTINNKCAGSLGCCRMDGEICVPDFTKLCIPKD
jgi:hypothetical protein